MAEFGFRRTGRGRCGEQSGGEPREEPAGQGRTKADWKGGGDGASERRGPGAGNAELRDYYRGSMAGKTRA